MGVLMPEDFGTLNETEELAIEAIARGAVYGFLSAMFLKPPDAALVNSLKNEFIPSLKDLTLTKTMTDGLRELESLLSDLSEGDDEKLLMTLASDFTLLIRGIRPKDSPPPPYEGLYRGDVLFGEATKRVMDDYGAFEVGPLGQYEGEPPDHIGLELAFLQFLCMQEAESWKKGDENRIQNVVTAQERFLSEHLGLWIGSLHEKVRARDETGFYSAVIEITKGWIEQDMSRPAQPER